MISNRYKSPLWSLAALSVLAAAALSGCGGNTTNGNIDGVVTSQADPYIYSYNENGDAGPTFVSALGISSATGLPVAPTATAAGDYLYFTFASANSKPSDTLPAVGPFETGVSEIASDTVFAAAQPGQAGVVFRAQAAQGQLPNNTEPVITSASVTEAANETTYPFALAYGTPTAASGPFNASPYATALSLSSIATSGVYTFTASITDAASQSTTTTFEAVIIKEGYEGIASSEPITVEGTVPTVSYGPDASGTYVVIVPAGTYNVSIGGAAASSVTLADVPVSGDTTSPTMGPSVTVLNPASAEGGAHRAASRKA